MLLALAWLYNFNRGVIIAPGREEEWTLSIQHTDEDIDRYVSGLQGPGRRRDRVRQTKLT